MKIQYLKSFTKLNIPHNCNTVGITDHLNGTLYIKLTGNLWENLCTLLHELAHFMGFNKNHRSGQFSYKGGGGGAPAAPAVPQYEPEKDYKAYIKFAPQVAQAQIGIAPQFAASELDLINRYGPSISQALQRSEASVYPYSAGLQEQLAKLANQGMSGGLPKELRDLYREQLRAELGPNVGSPIGGDYISRGLIQGGEDYNRYYQNLGASLAGRIPITAPGGPQARYTPEGLTPNQGLASGASAYGSYVSALANVYSSQVAGSQKGGGGGLGAAIGLGSQIFGGLFCWVASEVFGGWNHPQTQNARLFFIHESPRWILNLYKKYGEQFARFIHTKPHLKMFVRLVFTNLAKRGAKYVY